MIQENIVNKACALQELKEHPMCFDVREDKDTLIVEYPYWAGADGVRVCNTAKGLQQALHYCEQAWQHTSL